MTTTKTLVLCLVALILAIATNLYISIHHSGHAVLYFLLGITLLLLITLARKIRIDKANQTKSERTIKHNQEITSLIMNSALDAIICIDAGGAVTAWNAQAEKMFGWKEKEILGKRLDETIIPEKYRHGHRTGFDHYRKTGEGPLLSKLIETSALNRSGDEFPIELTIVPIKQNESEFFCAFIRDITQRKQAEEQLFWKRNLFRAVIDNLPDYIYAKDTKHHYIMGNRAIVDLIGAGSEEGIIGKNSLELFGQEVALENFDEDGKLIALGTPVINREESITSYTGDKLCLLTTKVPLRDKDGKITGLIGISRDITKRKESELQLRESEEKYRTLFESNLAGVFRTDIEGKILNCNDAFATMLGYHSHKEIEQKNAGIFYFSRSDRKQYISLLRKKGHLANHELILKNKDGRAVYGLININLRKDSLTNELIIEGIILDITERKKAEEELKAAHDRVFFHLDNSPLGFIEWDRKIKPRSWSRRAEEIFGWTVKEVTSEQFDWFSKIYKEDLPRVIKIAKQLVAGEMEKVNVQYRNYTKDGRLIWCEWFSSALKDQAGKVITILSLVQDITERKQGEEKIFKSGEQYRDLVDNITDLICTHSLDGRILSMNRAAEELIAHKFDPQENLNIRDVLAPDKKYKFDSYITELTKNGHAEGLMKVQTFTGDIRIWEYSNSLKTTGEETPVVRGYARDITESKKAEKELRKSEERLNEAQIIAQVGNWEIDLVKNISIWSDEIYRIYGLTKGEEQPSVKLFLSFMHPDDSNYAEEKMKEAFATLKNSSFDFRFIRKDGAVRHGCIEWKFEFGKNENPIRIYGIVQDATDRKKAEEALSANELRFRTLTSNAPVGIFQSDAAGKTIYVNQTWLNYTGLTFDEAIGDGWQGVIHPDDKKLQLEQWEDRFKKGLESHSEFRIVDKKGNIRWVIGKATPLFNKKEITGYIGTLSDITEIKKAEEALRQSEIRLNEAQAIAQVGNWEIDLIRNKLTWSDQVYKIFGIKKNEADPSTELFLSFMHPGDADFANKKMQEAFDSLKASSFHFRFIRNDGSVRHGSNEWKFEFDNDGKPLRLYGIIQDITERKKAEQELQQINEELRNLSSHLQNVREEERIQIARDIHDELGQQLTGLKMDVGWLHKKMITEDEMVTQKMNSMVHLIDETVKTVRRISSNLRPSILDDLGLIAALEWHSEEVGKRSEIKVDFSTDMVEPDITVAMATGIFRIYQEVLTNAVRHSNAQIITSSLQLKDNCLVLKIKDDGRGMDTTIAGTKKTLGLIGIKERTFVLGGKYDLKSEPGRGTEVQISIPLYKP